jgi:hypothetical protein
MPIPIADAIAGAARSSSLGDLAKFGLPMPNEGVFFRMKHRDRLPSAVDMNVIDAIRDGVIEVVAAVEAFDTDGVVLVDGSRLNAYAVIFATGYQGGVEPLVGHRGVLDASGKPVAVGERPAAPGLRFIGFDVRPSFMGHMAKLSTRMAKRIADELPAA